MLRIMQAGLGSAEMACAAASVCAYSPGRGFKSCRTACLQWLNIPAGFALHMTDLAGFVGRVGIATAPPELLHVVVRQT